MLAVGSRKRAGDSYTGAIMVQTVRIGDYPQLHRAAWHVDEETIVTEGEALGLYERNWRYVDAAAMSPEEKRFLAHLADRLSHGRLLV
jgi:hypothetical protein